MLAVGEAFTIITSNPTKYAPVEPNNPPGQEFESLVHTHQLQVCWAGHEGKLGGDAFVALVHHVLAAAP